MSKKTDNKGKEVDEELQDKDSINELADKQLQRIKELEEQFGDRYIPSGDATKIINVQEIESKLSKEDKKIFNSETNELNFDVPNLNKMYMDNNEEKDNKIIKDSKKNIIDEDENMPRSSRKRKKPNKKTRSTKGNVKKAPTKQGKKSKKRKKPKSKFKLILKWLVSIFLAVFLLLVGLAFAYIFGVFGQDKSLTKEDLIIANENSTVYDRSGKLVATLVDDEKREIVTLSEMPEYLPKMYIAIEDERFYKHKGVDFKRTISATVSYLLKRGQSDYGASTITQQLIKNITEDDERSWERKLREITRALQVEREITKEQVLELYLNVIFVGGDNIHGVALGSDYYFGKSQKDLTMAEAAFMAGINHMPNAYNPFLLSIEIGRASCRERV